MRAVLSLLLVAILTSGVLAGCLSKNQASSGARAPVSRGVASPARDPSSPAFKPHVVVAVLDSGINPYHSEYAEQYDNSDPADYIPGYPADVIPLKLSEFKAPVPRFMNRELADEVLWNTTRAGQLYRVEGTKIVGLITFAPNAQGSTNLPGGGHGTMTSSRAVGNTVSVGGPEIRVVMVMGISAAAIKWAAEQPWIDIISISAGISGVNPVVGNVQDGAGMRTQNDAAHAKPFFASSGNGLGNTGTAGFPAWLRGASGVPDVLSVGANDNGKMSQWHNQHSYIVGDGCQNPSATDNTKDRVANTGGGTSSATPFSAGGGAHLLLEARRILGDAHVGVRYSDQPIPSFNGWKTGHDGDAKVILAQGNASGIAQGPLADGVFTLQEFKDLVYHTAIGGGSEDKSDGNACVGPAGAYVPTSGVPRDVLVQFEGYGEVNGKSIDHATKVLRGEDKVPARPGDDAWYDRFYALRKATMPQ